MATMGSVKLSVDTATPVLKVPGEVAETDRQRDPWKEALRLGDLAAKGNRVAEANTHFRRALAIALDYLGSVTFEGHQIMSLDRYLTSCQRILDIHQSRGERDDAAKLRRQRFEVLLDLAASDRFPGWVRFAMISDLRTALRDYMCDLRKDGLEDTMAAAMVDVACDAICVTTISGHTATSSEVRSVGQELAFDAPTIFATDGR